jgi:hypothetical protein
MALLGPATSRFAIALTLLTACDPADEAACIPVGDALRAAPNAGEREQGTSFQGTVHQGEKEQGRHLPGEKDQGTTYQGTKIGLSTLAGMRIELADGSPVTMQQGRLVAGAAIDNDALRDADLIGISQAGERFSLRITAIAEGESSERIAIEAGGAPVCADGNAGMFVPGSWDDTGRHSVVADELTYSCMDGVIAKCVDWGYAPWLVGADVHQSCTRLARADYCGDGQPWTLDGTKIDVYDTLGVQQTVNVETFGFEAAWGTEGAVCVAATLYDIADADGETILPDCFAELPRCESLAQATTLGAVLANDSAHTPIDACT